MSREKMMSEEYIMDALKLDLDVPEGVNERIMGKAKQRGRQRGQVNKLVPAIAACAAVMLLSGMGVLAVESFFVDRVSESVMDITHKDTEATSEQKEILAKISEPTSFEVELPKGRLCIDAVCYDQGYLVLPFRYYTNQNLDLKPGEETYHANGILSQASKLRFRRKGDKMDSPYALASNANWMGQYGTIDPVVQEDGSLKGTLMPYIREGFFREGDVIECGFDVEEQPVGDVIRQLEEGEDTTGLRVVEWFGALYEDLTNPPEILYELTLGKEPERIGIGLETVKMPEEIVLEDMSLSSLSLWVSGHFGMDEKRGEQLLDMITASAFHNTTVVLKDGTVVAGSPTGSGGGGGNSGGGNYRFQTSVFFEEPINPEDAEWIHIDGTQQSTCEAFDLWIPVRQQ